MPILLRHAPPPARPVTPPQPPRSFSPNTGYAFAVDKDTWHSVETVGPEVQTRDSILLTYFVDKTPVQVFRNRSKRVGNFFLNEYRHLAR